MRITAKERECIKQAAREVWGNSVKVFLFGSRTNDSKRGGDIDLYIKLEGNETSEKLIRQKAAFLSKLDILIGEQKIDVIIDTPENENLPVIKTARKEGLIL